MSLPRGTFFPVVGPSGAGKDTLLDAVRAALAGDPRYLFVQRAITRPADAGGEAHRAVSAAQFAAEEAAGRFALSWRAHELAYGIPIEVEDALAAGRHVIANLSRAAVAEAAARYERLCVLHITAPPEVLRTRLAARGREDSEMQAARVARSAALPEGVAVVEIVNDDTVEAGVKRLLEVLQAGADSPVIPA